MNAWSHLPNACHIDRVLESVKSHPKIWNAAKSAAWNAARDPALAETWNATLGAAMYAARHEAWDEAWIAARNAAQDAAWVVARNAVSVLVAYDDASKYLDMPVDQLRFWSILSEDPAAVLLLPAVIAFERINELELA